MKEDENTEQRMDRLEEGDREADGLVSRDSKKFANKRREK